jgi:hypothetical protein
MTAAPPWGLISVTPQHTATSTSARRRSLAPSDARKQHRRQGEEAQDEAGVEVGPDQEDDRKPRARLRASEGRVQDEDPAEQRIQLRAHVEERSRHRQPEGRRDPAGQSITGKAHQEPEEDQPRDDDHEPLPVRQALQSERVRPTGRRRPSRAGSAPRSTNPGRAAGHAHPQATSCTCRRCSYMRFTTANTNAVDQPIRMIPARPSIPASTRQGGPRTTSP